MMDVKGLAKIAGEGGEKGPVAGQQIMLPWSEAFRISIKNVVLRLGRAAITATGIVLGVAFLTYVLSDRVFSEGMEQARLQQEQTLITATEEVRGGGSVGEPVSAEEQQARQMSAQREAEALAQERKARQIWLAVMSLLVCGIGITNSMLMSVTERFQEIGTMKCLGALDSFIVRLFLIEAAVIGLLGSLVGILLGLLFVMLIYTIKYGSSVTAKVDWPQLFTYMLFAMAVGAFISLMSAIPPSVRAARMPPAAALRSEI